jgi:hypothetical protein
MVELQLQSTLTCPKYYLAMIVPVAVVGMATGHPAMQQRERRPKPTPCAV